MPMTDAEKAIAYDRLVAAFAEALRAQGWGTPGYRSYDQLKAEVVRLDALLSAAEAEAGALQRDLALCEQERNQAIGEIERLRAALAACEAKLPPEPPPPEPAKWRTIWEPQKISDWRIVRDAGQITNPAPGKFRLRVEAPVGSGSHHCEIQELGRSPRGIEIAYEWVCTILPGTVFPSAPHSTTIHQSHATDQTGYGGGILGYRDGRLRLHVRGGKVTDPKGSIHREFEEDFFLDPFRFKIGEPFTIRREVRWDAVKGYSRCFVNGEKLHEVLDVPTFPEERAEGSMMRVGFYPGDGEVNPLLDMTVERLRFQVPA